MSGDEGCRVPRSARFRGLNRVRQCVENLLAVRGSPDPARNAGDGPETGRAGRPVGQRFRRGRETRAEPGSSANHEEAFRASILSRFELVAQSASEPEIRLVISPSAASRDTRCSTSSDPNTRRCGLRQYPHRSPACRWISSRSSPLMCVVTRPEGSRRPRFTASRRAIAFRTSCSW